MRVKVYRYDPEREEKPILPSSGNFRKQDLWYFRIAIIVFTIMLLYCGPYKTIVMENIHEETGLLQDVIEVVGGGRRDKTITGLDLDIEGKVYFLSGRHIGGQNSDEVWKIKNLGHKLRKINTPVTIKYFEYKDYHGIDNYMVVEVVGDNNEWINMEYALSVRKAMIKGDVIVLSLAILVFIILHYLRKNYILEIKK